MKIKNTNHISYFADNLLEVGSTLSKLGADIFENVEIGERIPYARVCETIEDWKHNPNAWTTEKVITDGFTTYVRTDWLSEPAGRYLGCEQNIYALENATYILFVRYNRVGTNNTYGISGVNGYCLDNSTAIANCRQAIHELLIHEVS